MNALGVFKPNNHSDPRITFQRVSDAQLVSAARRVAPRFGMRDLLGICEPLPRGRSSTNLVLRGNKEAILLKRIEITEDVSGSAGIQATTAKLLVMEEAGRLGGRVPRIIRSDEAGLVLNEEGGLFCAMEFIEGDRFRGSTEELANAAISVARLHWAMSKITDSGDLPKKVMNIQELSSLLSRADRELEWSNEFDELLLGNISFLRECLDRSAVISEDDGTRIVHGDLHPHNIVGNVIIDFDLIGIGPLTRDIAFALHRLVRQHIVHTNPSDLNDAVERACGIFLDRYSSVYPMWNGEIRRITDYITAEALWRGMIQIRRRLDGTGDFTASELRKHLMSLHEAEYFECIN